MKRLLLYAFIVLAFIQVLHYLKAETDEHLFAEYKTTFKTSGKLQPVPPQQISKSDPLELVFKKFSEWIYGPEAKEQFIYR